MSNVWIIVLLGIGSYFFGNINWALLISKAKKTDIRKLGSGNPGTLNMSRNLGLGFGLLTFVLDVLKGAIPTLVAFFVLKDRTFENTSFIVSDLVIYLCGFLAVMGHIYPVLLKFKGGKGIASTIGVLIVCESVHGIGWACVAIMSCIAAVVFIYLTEFGAMGSFIAITPPAISGSIRLFLTYAHISNVSVFLVISDMLILLLCFFTWFAHRKNIERMLAGEEHPTSIKEMVVKARAKRQNKNNGDNQPNNDIEKNNIIEN